MKKRIIAATLTLTMLLGTTIYADTYPRSHRMDDTGDKSVTVHMENDTYKIDLSVNGPDNEENAEVMAPLLERIAGAELDQFKFEQNSDEEPKPPTHRRKTVKEAQEEKDTWEPQFRIKSTHEALEEAAAEAEEEAEAEAEAEEEAEVEAEEEAEAEAEVEAEADAEEHAKLGVEVMNTSDDDYQPGVKILSIADDSCLVDTELVEGSIITHFNHKRIISTDRLVDLVKRQQSGDRVIIRAWIPRDDGGYKQTDVRVTLK